MNEQTANPQVDIDSTVSSRGMKKWFSTRLIFVILAIFVFVAIVLAMRTLIKPTPRQGVPSQQINIPKKSKIAFLADKKEYKVGDVIPVAVNISTGGKAADGIDLVARFDPKIFEGTTAAIIKGTIYPEYPVAKVEGEDVIRISGVTSVGADGFKGEGTLAIILLKAIKPGKATLTIDFKPGDTTDSNIVAETEPQDILEEVGNLELTIR